MKSVWSFYCWVCLFACCGIAVHAQTLGGPGVVNVQNVQLVVAEGDTPGYTLNADFDIALTPRLEEAVTRGVPLTFVIEFELGRRRWYWWDAEIAQHSQTWRLSYQSLTRQYRLALGTLQFRFNTLAEALRTLGRVRQWHVLNRAEIKPGETYQAQTRLRLDTTLLPKPFQVNAITSSDWSLTSDWKRFSFTPSQNVENKNGDGKT